MVSATPKTEFNVSLFLPAFNERENLSRAVKSLVAAASSVCSEYEVIIVEDGSTDGTAALADELARDLPEVRVIHNPQNDGYGPALLRGFAAARYDVVFYTDADNQYDYGQFAEFLPLLSEYDVVLGYRRRRVDPATRLFFAWAYSLFLKVMLGFRWRDPDCSFKYFRRAAIAPITISSRSGFVEAELIMECERRGLQMCQVPVAHYGRPAGTVSFELFRLGPLSLVRPGPIWAMVKDVWRYRQGRRAWRDTGGAR